ncbi:hypothetical protein C9374_013723 [Naegleria lovaniensis]|uniref:Uncharacterized protein n=1 Tax=Naegleria lovaniensis TaxID=51637 RepID=A0AA88GBH5_NAELO|nr:uncharacterized protein C9374_013723 [Naegleria lovaniensis]KAG2370923.1 hypothetical protein C9374_013723 [Naegleria lovaniensis]
MCKRRFFGSQQIFLFEGRRNKRKKQKKDVYDSRPADTTARGLKSTTTSLEAVQNFVSNIQNEERQQVVTYLEGSYDEDEDEDYEEGDDDDNDGQDEDFDEDEDLEEDLLDDAGNNQEEKEKVNSTNSSQHNLPHTATQFQPSKIDSPTTPSNSALASETPKKPRTKSNGSTKRKRVIEDSEDSQSSESEPENNVPPSPASGRLRRGALNQFNNRSLSKQFKEACNYGRKSASF